jgi:uncharacterized protein YjbI with pentapeptide repeats
VSLIATDLRGAKLKVDFLGLCFTSAALTGMDLTEATCAMQSASHKSLPF